jgi:hypothetical protein
MTKLYECRIINVIEIVSEIDEMSLSERDSLIKRSDKSKLLLGKAIEEGFEIIISNVVIVRNIGSVVYVLRKPIESTKKL